MSAAPTVVLFFRVPVELREQLGRVATRRFKNGKLVNNRRPTVQSEGMRLLTAAVAAELAAADAENDQLDMFAPPPVAPAPLASKQVAPPPVPPPAPQTVYEAVIKPYREAHAREGLCRACPEPVAVSSKGKNKGKPAKLCRVHLAADSARNATKAAKKRRAAKKAKKTKWVERWRAQKGRRS